MSNVGSKEMEQNATAAAAALRAAEALLITAGAGMGVDSGLPDFRGDEGFWMAYPPFRQRGLSFVDLANPDWFELDPPQAWGFYGHRLMLYRSTPPHAGFSILRRWAERCQEGYFVFTSNVDGHFQAAGFGEDRVYECHGSIHFQQCVRPCSAALWPADEAPLDIDAETFRARPPLPSCPHCGAMARPNVLMFGDGEWVPDRSNEQATRYRDWRSRARHQRLVVVELGAGTAVPTVRLESERVGGTVIRINPRETWAPHGAITFTSGALAALEAIDRCLADGIA